MAEIEIERRPRRSGWKWLLLALILVAVAVGAWFAFQDGGIMSDARPATEQTTEEPAGPEPVQPLEREPETR